MCWASLTLILLLKQHWKVLEMYIRCILVCIDSSEKLLWGEVNQGMVKSKRKSNISPEGSLSMAICAIPHLSYVSIHQIRFPFQNQAKISGKLRKPLHSTILWDSSTFVPVIFDRPQNLCNVSIDLRKNILLSPSSVLPWHCSVGFCRAASHLERNEGEESWRFRTWY